MSHADRPSSTDGARCAACRRWSCTSTSRARCRRAHRRDRRRGGRAAAAARRSAVHLRQPVGVPRVPGLDVLAHRARPSWPRPSPTSTPHARSARRHRLRRGYRQPDALAGWDLGELIDALTHGFDRAEADGLAECHLLLSILRAQSGDEAAGARRVDGRAPAAACRSACRSTATRRAPGRTGPRFAAGLPTRRPSSASGAPPTPASRRAPRAFATRSTCCTSTASTTACGPIDDPELVQRLVDDDITLNVCLSSQPRAPVLRPADAPVRRLCTRAGVPITLNTDDPGYLGIDLTGEFVKAATACRLGPGRRRGRDAPGDRRRLLPGGDRGAPARRRRRLPCRSHLTPVATEDPT